MWSVTVVTQPAAEPITTDEAKRHLRIVDETHEDDDIDALIATVRRRVEETRDASIYLMECTVALRLSGFPCGAIYLPRCPGLGAPPVDVSSVTYTDTSGTEQTLSASAYVVDPYSRPPCIVPAYGTSWPSTRDVPNAVVVTYTVGFASADDVPDQVKHAIKIGIADEWENRESRITGTIVAELNTVEMNLAGIEAGRMRYDVIYG
jgi:uncharacterized phiE125 gp8 family phage protein